MLLVGFLRKHALKRRGKSTYADVRIIKIMCTLGEYDSGEYARNTLFRLYHCPGPMPMYIYTYKSPRTVVRGLFKHFFFKTVYLIISVTSFAAAFSIGIGIIVPDGLKPLPQYHSSNAAFPTSL